MNSLLQLSSSFFLDVLCEFSFPLFLRVSLFLKFIFKAVLGFPNLWLLTLCILCSQRWRHSIQSAKTRPGADCGSDHELLITKFRLKLKKVVKTTRSLRHDLNQISYTVEVTNGFKILDLIDWVPEEQWTEVRDTVQEAAIKTIPKKKKCKKAKWLSEEVLQIAEKRSQRQGEKERHTHLNAEFQRIARRDKKAFLSDQCKEIEENNRMRTLEITSRKLEIPREHFMQRWAQ